MSGEGLPKRDESEWTAFSVAQPIAQQREAVSRTGIKGSCAKGLHGMKCGLAGRETCWEDA